MRTRRDLPHSTVRRSLGAAGFALLLALGCVAPAKSHTPPGVTRTFVEDLGFSRAPADVMVAPVRDTSGALDAPKDGLRQVLYQGLVARLFSPVALGFVDGRIETWRAEPSVADDRELVLRTTISRWDSSALESAGVVDAEVEAELVRLVDGAPLVLWRTFLTRRLGVDGNVVRRSPRADVMRMVAERVGAEILAELPARGSIAPPGQGGEPSPLPPPSARTAPAPAPAPASPANAGT